MKYLLKSMIMDNEIDYQDALENFDDTGATVALAKIELLKELLRKF